MRELSKRVIVAGIGIPISVVFVFLGGIYLLIPIIVISGITLFEFYSISENKNFKPNKYLGIGFGIVIQIIFYSIFSNWRDADDKYLIITLSIFTLLTLTLELWLNKQDAIANVSITMAGVIYIPVLFSFVIGIRCFFESYPEFLYSIIKYNQSEILKERAGTFLVMFIFISVWLSDSGAYFIGRKLGKRKLFPRISPKKTYEGAIAGFILGIFSFTMLMLFLYPSFPLIHSIIIGIIIGITCIIGDLTESMLKRDSGVKDSSNILPGHGGMLDRFDSILFVFPSVYIYLYFVLKFYLY